MAAVKPWKQIFVKTFDKYFDYVRNLDEGADPTYTRSDDEHLIIHIAVEWLLTVPYHLGM